MKKYSRPDTLIENIEISKIIALSPSETETPEIDDSPAEEGEGMAKEIWGDIWK